MNIGEQFYGLIKRGFFQSEKRGECQIIVKDDIAQNFYLCLGDELTYHEGNHPNPTAALSLPMDVILKVVNHPDTWDPRLPEYAENISFSGDGLLINFVGELAKRPSAEVAQRLEAAVLQSRAADLMNTVTEVDRIENPGEAEVIERLRAGLPTIATGCLNEKGWVEGPEQLLQKFGQTPIKLGHDSIVLRQFLESMQEPDALYSGGSVLPPAMWSHFRMPFFDPSAFIAPQIWMGSRSEKAVSTELHRDNSHGFLGQLIGRKRFIVYSPEQIDLLYPKVAYNHYQPCRVDPHQPDYTRYPLFKDAKPIEFILNPGDLLINPIGWWHVVFSIDPVISISSFMDWNYWKGMDDN